MDALRLIKGNYMYKAVKNCEWVNAEHTQIKCEVNFDHVDFEEWTPFCADPTDNFAPYCNEIFYKAKAGEFGEIAEYIAPPVQDPYISTKSIPVVDVSPKVSNQSLQIELDTLKKQVEVLLANQQNTGA